MQRLKNYYLILSKRCRNTTNSIAFRPLLENVIACSAQFCETSAVISSTLSKSENASEKHVP